MASKFCSNWLKTNALETSLTFPKPQLTLCDDPNSSQIGGSEPTNANSAQTGASEPKGPNEIVFENNEFKLIVKPDRIKQNHRFKVADQQFNLLVIPKTSHNHPPLLEILAFLEDGFKFILKKIKTFVNRDEHRIAYLALYQQPMINALNSGPFDLHEDSAGEEMVSRILNMLTLYLNSNEDLKLNDSFKLYLTIFSIAHEKFRLSKASTRKRKKRTAHYYTNKRVHVGCNESTSLFKRNWAIDCPISYPRAKSSNIFKDKCLLLCIVLGLLQHSYYENKVEHKAYLYATQIVSSVSKKQRHAGNILAAEILHLQELCNLPPEGPYDLLTIFEIVHKKKNCQFFMFTGLAKRKNLELMFPPDYDDSLKPIYLYHQHNSNHVVFIKNVNVFFRANFRICFVCLKSFSSVGYRHICSKRETCFSCRRFYAKNSTYVKGPLLNEFCNRFTTTEASFKCTKCNLTLFSQHCSKGHRKICYGKGHLGWKCEKCNKFFYRFHSETSADIKNKHVCSAPKRCRMCFEINEEDHLCPLRKSKYPKFWPKLGFLNLEFLEEDARFRLFLISVYMENPNKYGTFEKVIFSDLPMVSTSDSHYFMSYFPENFTPNYDFKSKNLKQDFKVNLNTLFKKNGQNIMKIQLLQVLLGTENMTYICQDENSIIMMTILEALLEEGFCPTVIRNGRRFKMLSIDELNVKIVPSYNYFSGNEFQLAVLFDIQFEQHYFPYSFFVKEHLNYEGRLPSIHYFMSNFDTNEVTQKKLTFYEQHKNCKWNLIKELLIYSNLKLDLLTLATLKFLKESFKFQEAMLLKLQRNNDYFLHPFSHNIISLSGYVYVLFRLLFLNNYDIRIVRYENGYPMRKISRQEYDWSSYWIHRHPNIECLTALNNPRGQKFFEQGMAVPDLYSVPDKTCYFYNGCWVHSHYDNCSINPNSTGESLNIYGDTFKTVNDKFWTKLNTLLVNHPAEIDRITVEWECNFLKTKLTNEYKVFEQRILKNHPLERLSSRKCFRGGYFDVCGHKWSQKTFPNETLHFIDCTGLYSYVTINNAFMTGPYKVIIGEAMLKDLKVINNEFFYENKRISGGLLLTILPPKNLLYPFLLYKTKFQKTVLTLCCKCSESFAKLCKHSDYERALTGCYMICEIEFALCIGYKILDIFECHAYFSSDYIFKQFVQALDYFKQVNSFDKLDQADCQRLNEHLCSSDFQFRTTDFKKNISKRNYYKHSVNSLFGKIAQRNDFTKTVYVSSQEELESLYFSTNELQQITCINEQVCQVVLKPSTKMPRINRNTNCYIGAQITALARIEMFKQIQSVHSVPNSFMYYIDTDSLVFSLPKSSKCPITISPKCGDFKVEYKNISNFWTLGIKSYFLSFNDGTPQKICKIKGLRLSYGGQAFKEEIFDSLVVGLLNNMPMSTKVKQGFWKADFNKLRTYLEEKLITVTNTISLQRVVQCDERLSSLPYGYIPT